MAKGRVSTPYSQSAAQYHSVGWSPIPLPPRQKSPVPDGFTGADGRYVDDVQLRRWLRGDPLNVGRYTFRPGNVAIRMPKNVVGIDVDAYDGKAGARTLKEREAVWGPLPATWQSTSRPGTGSGIRWFRVPEGLAWPGTVGPGIEVIRWDHRYALVYPSIHDKTGNQYVWLNPKGKVAKDYAPAPGELKKLPKAWVEGLTEGKRWTNRPVAEMDASDMQRWLSDRPEPDSPCDAMRELVRGGKLTLMKAGDDGGAHDAARDLSWGVLRDAGAGHYGAAWALGELRNAFLVSVEGRRGDLRQARQEWARLVQRGMGKVAAEGAMSHADPCDALAAGMITIKDGSRLDLTERGNAERLAEVAAGRLLYQEDQKVWVCWDEETGLWRVSEIQPERWAVKAIDDLEASADDESMDKKVRNSIRSHCKTSRKPAGFSSTLAYYRGRPGVAVKSASFDADGSVLAVPNGIVRLGKDGASFRRLLTRDDRVTMVAGAEYVDGAASREWESFLERIQPSPDVRAWLARLVGYSLMGSNPARRFIVGMGPTTSGKGTFIGALSAMLGDYAAITNLTIFRDNQDERPRADLADAILKRIVFMDEASHSWKLHPDQVKRMTGAGEISARRPFAKASVVRRPAFTPWLLTNSAPHIEGADSALKRRLIVVPFAEMLRDDEVDVELADRLTLPEVRAAVLQWALRGYDSLRTMGYEEGLATPLDAMAVRGEFTSQMSDFDAFLAKLCDVGDEFRELPSQLASAWEQWMDTNGLQGRDRVKPQTFARTLNANGYPTKLDRDAEGKVVRYRMGLRLVDGWENLVESAL